MTQQDENENHLPDENEIFYCRFENNKLLVDLLIHLALDTTKDYECYVEATPDSKSFITASTTLFYNIAVLMFSVLGRGKSMQVRF